MSASLSISLSHSTVISAHDLLDGTEVGTDDGDATVGMQLGDADDRHIQEYAIVSVISR